MRILHTADWHLGRIFYNVHLTEDQAYILDQFSVLVADVRPDVVIIAGDVYDRSVPPPEAVTLLNETLSKISLDLNVPVIITAGNHDSPERLGFGDKIMSRQKLHVVTQAAASNQPVILEDTAGPVYFCPLPYAEPAVVRERLDNNAACNHELALAAQIRHIYRTLPPNARKVAIAHAFVAGGAGSESERPLSIGGISTVSAQIFSGFDYVALGHLHQPQQIDSPKIRYSGSLLRYSFAEANQRKSVSLVELDPAGAVTVEEVALSPRRNVRRLEGRLEEIIQEAKNDPSHNDYIMVTLADTGAILDPLGKLRAVYPNVLHLERSQYSGGSAIQTGRRDHRRLGEAELFADFFGQVTGNPLSDNETIVLERLLNDFNRREREVSA